MPISDLTRNQIIVPFGVGGVYDYKDFSAMTMEVDQWSYHQKDCEFLNIPNPRFIAYINNKLRLYEGFKSKRIFKLILPPIALDANMSDEAKKQMGTIAVKKFPIWGLCSRCQALSKFDPQSVSTNRCKNPYVSKRRQGLMQPCASIRGAGILEPVRFIAYCGKGHMQDFPWAEFMSINCTSNCDMKTESHNAANPSLYLSDDSMGNGFTSLELECRKCNETKRMTGIQDSIKREAFLDTYGKKIFQCAGSSPWSKDANEECDQTLEIEPRAASKTYSSITVSSLYIPGVEAAKHAFEESDEFFNLIDRDVIESKARDMIDTLKLDEKYNIKTDRMIQMIKDERQKIDDAMNTEINEEQSEVDFRFEEYKTLCIDQVDDERFISKRIPSEKYNPNIINYFTSIHKIKKLYTHTALMGFSRMSSQLFEKIDSFNPARKNVNFLPGYEVIGEGIFINFGYDKILKWLAANKNFSKKTKQLIQNGQNHKYSKLKETQFNYAHVMIHTFSHLFMNQLSIQCGYSLTEIKERIYFDEKAKMAGVLVYTAASDAAGSMGGLVRMADPILFEPLLISAIRNAYACSNDPICFDSTGQGHSSLCLAACHACAMIPDLACDDDIPSNTFLDRNSLISNELNAIGYFENL
ncbi:DUF1998 domain-containing protein [Gammaproteobacteria bacterium]|nr:DUF1998 domain-containing protein [Gammaproteobacteria bacterium]